MFTGIVEKVGTIKSINRGQHSAVLTVRAKTVLEETRIGDSIAVNGICLTVRQLFPDSFAADVMHETLNRSALAQLTIGSAVNLERAMPANGRFGGHIVAGHVMGSDALPTSERTIPLSGTPFMRIPRSFAMSSKRVPSRWMA